MKAIQQQLGEDGYGSDQEELEELQQQIKAIQNISDQSRGEAVKRMGQAQQMPAMSQEAGVIRGYLETVLELPWDSSTEDNVDLKQARKILNEGPLRPGKGEGPDFGKPGGAAAQAPGPGTDSLSGGTSRGGQNQHWQVHRRGPWGAPMCG